MRLSRRLLCVVLLVATLGGCATQSEVRATCAQHRGMGAVNGNMVRKFVACKDGYYRTVR
jgi:hypothetical protein